MSEIRVASRYAKSLIGLAQEKRILEDVHNDLYLFMITCDDSRDLRLMLKNPIISSDKKLMALKAIFGKRFSEMTTLFFEIVSRKNRAPLLHSIAQQVHYQYNLMKGIESATVTTAMPLDRTLRVEFQNMVQKISGKEVELDQKINPEIIGGFVLQIADKQIDASIKTKIQSLKRAFEA